MRLHTLCGWSKNFPGCTSGSCSDIIVSDVASTGATYVEYGASSTGSASAMYN